MSTEKLPVPFLTGEDILEIGQNYSKEESPIDLNFDSMKEVKVSQLEWGNFQIRPKLMKISNSGMTAVLSGKWQGPRPFLSNGPLTGKYIFSQLHFHWGRSFQEGSEHRINGKGLSLEAHLMFFKNTYECLENAMKKPDGIVTIAYFFKLQREDNHELDAIMDALPNITQPFSSKDMSTVPLNQFAPEFSEDYFMYWGNVYKMNVLWLINRKPIGISQNQLLLFKNLLDADNKPIEKNYRDPRELNNRIVFYVNPSGKKSDILLPMDSEIKKDTNLDSTSSGLPEEGTGDILKNKNSLMHLLNFNLLKAPNLAEFKFALVETLLELEKKENNDYGLLESYIKLKYASQKKKVSFSENEIEDIFKKEDHPNPNLVESNDEDAKENSPQKKLNIIDEIFFKHDDSNFHPQKEENITAESHQTPTVENEIAIENLTPLIKFELLSEHNPVNEENKTNCYKDISSEVNTVNFVQKPKQGCSLVNPVVENVFTNVCDPQKDVESSNNTNDLNKFFDLEIIEGSSWNQEGVTRESRTESSNRSPQFSNLVQKKSKEVFSLPHTPLSQSNSLSRKESSLSSKASDCYNSRKIINQEKINSPEKKTKNFDLTLLDDRLAPMKRRLERKKQQIKREKNNLENNSKNQPSTTNSEPPSESLSGIDSQTSTTKTPDKNQEANFPKTWKSEIKKDFNREEVRAKIRVNLERLKKERDAKQSGTPDRSVWKP